MRIVRSIIMLGSGAFIGIAFVLSCGDGSPKAADAADGVACNCPAAEPPIPARVMEIRTDDVVQKNSMHVRIGASCPGVPQQAMTLTGGCTADFPAQGSLNLEESAPGGIGWGCTWSNASNVDVPVHVIVRCLVPQ
jgi:hypothetical protein